MPPMTRNGFGVTTGCARVRPQAPRKASRPASPYAYAAAGGADDDDDDDDDDDACACAARAAAAGLVSDTPTRVPPSMRAVGGGGGGGSSGQEEEEDLDISEAEEEEGDADVMAAAGRYRSARVGCLARVIALLACIVLVHRAPSWAWAARTCGLPARTSSGAHATRFTTGRQTRYARARAPHTPCAGGLDAGARRTRAFASRLRARWRARRGPRSRTSSVE
jgi:hypothetical protein